MYSDVNICFLMLFIDCFLIFLCKATTVSKRSGGSKVQLGTNDELWEQCLLYPHRLIGKATPFHVDHDTGLEFGLFTDFFGKEQDFKQIVHDKIINRLMKAQVLSKWVFTLLEVQHDL